MQPGSRIAQFEILELVGFGGMGEVYRARDTRLGREVAVKVLPAESAGNPGRLKRFEQEARAVAALDHPNILAVHDAGAHEGTPFMVTEFLRGQNLGDRLRAGALPTRKALEIAIAVANGLAAAHEHGIIHRDLKPTNIFLTDDGHVKILDFGLAKLAERGDAGALARATTAKEATQVGTPLGTVGYMSPEQVRGLTVDHRSDVFSLGCVLYEMLATRRAFSGQTSADVMAAILHEDPPGLDDGDPAIPPVVRQILRRCLEKAPNDRFRSAHDLALALEAVVSGTPSGHVPVVGQHPRLSWKRAAPAVGLAAAALAAGVWLVNSRRTAPIPEFRPRQVTTSFGADSKPAISPSGHEVAFTAEVGGRTSVWLSDVHGGNALRLTDRQCRDWGPAWFPDGGAIAFSSDLGGAISVWKVARLGGTPMLLVDNAQDPAISADGSRIAFARRGEDGFLRIWVAPLAEPENAHRLTGAGDGLWGHANPAWSPDGRTICYADQRDLWLVPADGGPARMFTHDDANDYDPVFSASGRYIYFTSNREGTRALWRKPVAGGEPIRVTRGAGPEQTPSLSRDGSRLAFASGQQAGAIVLVDMGTGAQTRVQERRPVLQPALAPDGSGLVFQSDLGGSVDLWYTPLREGSPVGEPVRLTDQPGAVNAPAFSPDGRWIAYFRVVNSQRDVWVVPARGGQPVNFTDFPGVNVQPAWSPDGAQIAFVSGRNGPYQVWAAPFSAGRCVGKPRQITHSPRTVAAPSWSPDGRRIAYVEWTGEGSDVWEVASDGTGAARRVTNDARAWSVGWSRKSGALLVCAFWGGQRPTIRMVPPEGGPARPVPKLEHVFLSATVPGFDLSRDETLLAFVESETQGDVWVLEAVGGTF